MIFLVEHQTFKPFARFEKAGWDDPSFIQELAAAVQNKEGAAVVKVTRLDEYNLGFQLDNESTVQYLLYPETFLEDEKIEEFFNMG